MIAVIYLVIFVGSNISIYFLAVPTLIYLPAVLYFGICGATLSLVLFVLSWNRIMGVADSGSSSDTNLVGCCCTVLAG